MDDNGQYVGPLPRQQADFKLIGRAPDGTFLTEPTAAYPPAMCFELAAVILQSWLERRAEMQTAPTLEVGVVALSLPPRGLSPRSGRVGERILVSSPSPQRR